MKEIELTQNKVALVDDRDFGFLNQWEWCAFKGRKTFYAYRKVNGVSILMHRVILDAKTGKEVDHKDRDGLNNQRNNIRLCVHKENQRNREAQRNSKSGHKGVSWDKSRNKWTAHIMRKNIGRYLAVGAAIKAYNAAAKEIFGEFAYLNPVEAK